MVARTPMSEARALMPHGDYLLAKSWTRVHGHDAGVSSRLDAVKRLIGGRSTLAVAGHSQGEPNDGVNPSVLK